MTQILWICKKDFFPVAIDVYRKKYQIWGRKISSLGEFWDKMEILSTDNSVSVGNLQLSLSEDATFCTSLNF